MKGRTSPIALGMCLGWSLGMLLGAAFHSMAPGSLLGMAAGGAVGAYRSRKQGPGGLRDPERTVGKIAGRGTSAFLAYPEEEPDPTPTIRATATLQRREGIRVFYLAPSSPQKAAGFRQEPRASLYLLAPSGFRGVCLSGTVEVLEESGHCVLKFTAEQGRYYTDSKSVIFQIPD